MPRFRRIIRPKSLVHVIIRFLNYERLLSSDQERNEYLRRLSRTFSATDWLLLSFALMSTHVHLAVIAGFDAFKRWSSSLNTGFANWLNPRRGRLGPVVAGRPKTKEVPLRHAGQLIAYHHNNPVEAGLVTTASASTWTSHRAYLGLERLDFVQSELGLELSGYSDTPDGRRAFNGFVNSLQGVEPAFDEVDVVIDDSDLIAARRQTRAVVGPAAELSYELLQARELRAHEVWTPEGAVVQRTWEGDLGFVLAYVSTATNVSVQALRSESRSAQVVAARRLFVLCARTWLGRPLVEVAGQLGMSSPGARRLERSASQMELVIGRQLADEILDLTTGGPLH